MLQRCARTRHHALFLYVFSGEVFDYLVAHGRMKEKEARAKFRQVSNTSHVTSTVSLMQYYLPPVVTILLCCHGAILSCIFIMYTFEKACAGQTACFAMNTQSLGFVLNSLNSLFSTDSVSSALLSSEEHCSQRLEGEAEMHNCNSVQVFF